jgi:hypothetical protein
MDPMPAHLEADDPALRPPTVEALLAWAQTAPQPPRELIVAYIRWLWLEQRLARSEMIELVRRLPELVPLQ